MGDSLTHGAVSYDYVAELSKDNELNNFIFINEGINSQFAYHQLNKVDRVVKIKPNEIFILIGTNDCRATLSDAEDERFDKLWKLPVKPTKEWFVQNLKALVDKLKAETSARITLISIPPLGEKVDSIPFQRSIEYSHDIKRIAEERNVGYIALNETLTEAIIKNGGKDIKEYELDLVSMYGAIFSHYLLSQSWDDISDKRGLLFLTDNVHLNNRGGNILIAKIKERLFSE
ncbi:MAG: SGNH/GDSL hydrolase family protein [Deltaproteobacteria bacterium]